MLSFGSFAAQTTTTLQETTTTLVEPSSGLGDLVLTWGTLLVAAAGVVYSAINGHRNRKLQERLNAETTQINAELVRVESEAVAVQQEQLRIERGREYRELAPRVTVAFESGEPLRPGQSSTERDWATQNPWGIRVTLDGALPVYDLVADLLWQSGQIKEYTVGAEHTFAGPSLPPLISVVPHERVEMDQITMDPTDKRAGDIYKRVILGPFAPGDSRWLGAQPEASGTGDTMEIRVIASADQGAWVSFHTIVVPDARELDPR